MADERYRQRAIGKQRMRRSSAAASSSDPAVPPASASDAAGRSRLSRRALWGTSLALGLTVGAWLFSIIPTSLPVPAGQEAGTAYRAATLALQPAPTGPLPPDHTSWPSCAVSTPMPTLQALDLVLAIDTTGSMREVLSDLKTNVTHLISSLRTGDGSVRVGLVAYRDRGDNFVTRALPLTVLDSTGVAALQAFVADLQASGGGDWPEAMDQALLSAASMAWRGNVPSSIVVLADAPPHPEHQENVLALARTFASRIPGGIVSVIDTGSGADRFLQALPRDGAGQYVTYDGHILHSLLPAITGCPDR